MTKPINLNRRDVATSASRKNAAYDILKAMYLQQHSFDHMPKNGRKWDYSHFDEWLAQKKKEFNC
jgi:hypothetical protein